MGNVRDVHLKQPAAGLGLGNVDSVVVILRVAGVDGDDELLPVVAAAGDLRLVRLLRHGARLDQHLFRKGCPQPVAGDGREYIDPRIPWPAEHLDHPADRIGGRVLPAFQVHNDRLSRLGGGVAGDVDAAVERLVVGLHPCELVLLSENADDSPGAAGKNLDHLAAHFLLVRSRAALAGSRTWCGWHDADAVAVERCVSLAAWDEDA